MSANAEARLHNGSAPPLGYRTYVAERRGKKDKKKLEIEPAERPLVDLICRLYLEGDGLSDPLASMPSPSGCASTAIPTALSIFHTCLVYAILTREIYVGRHYYDYGCRHSRSGEMRPREEWNEVAVPPILT